MLLSSAKGREESYRTAYDILLVEDDEDTREMLRECIESESSLHVLAFSSGEEVLQHLQEISEAAPCLIILDLLLPGMTGLQLYDHLSKIAGYKRVPTILLTASNMAGEIEAAIAGCNLALLTKPFEIADLLGYIENTLTGPAQLI